MPTIRNARARCYGGHKIPAFDNVSLQTGTYAELQESLCCAFITTVG